MSLCSCTHQFQRFAPTDVFSVSLQELPVSWQRLVHPNAAKLYYVPKSRRRAPHLTYFLCLCQVNRLVLTMHSHIPKLLNFYYHWIFRVLLQHWLCRRSLQWLVHTANLQMFYHPSFFCALLQSSFSVFLSSEWPCFDNDFLHPTTTKFRLLLNSQRFAQITHAFQRFSHVSGTVLTMFAHIQKLPNSKKHVSIRL